MRSFLDKHCIDIMMAVIAGFASIGMVYKAVSEAHSFGFAKRDLMLLGAVYIGYITLREIRVLMREWRSRKNASYQ